MVFPDLGETQIPLCTQKTMPGWDSVAAITLLTLIEEEFSTSINPELLPDLDSFQAIAGYLGKERTG